MNNKSTPMCINCLHCKTKNNSIYCKFGYFKDLQYIDACLLSPFDFDCYQMEIMDLPEERDVL